MPAKDEDPIRSLLNPTALPQWTSKVLGKIYRPLGRSIAGSPKVWLFFWVFLLSVSMFGFFRASFGVWFGWRDKVTIVGLQKAFMPVESHAQDTRKLIAENWRLPEAVFSDAGFNVELPGEDMLTVPIVTYYLELDYHLQATVVGPEDDVLPPWEGEDMKVITEKKTWTDLCYRECATCQCFTAGLSFVLKLLMQMITGSFGECDDFADGYDAKKCFLAKVQLLETPGIIDQIKGLVNDAHAKSSEKDLDCSEGSSFIKDVLLVAQSKTEELEGAILQAAPAAAPEAMVAAMAVKPEGPQSAGGLTLLGTLLAGMNPNATIQETAALKMAVGMALAGYLEGVFKTFEVEAEDKPFFRAVAGVLFEVRGRVAMTALEADVQAIAQKFIMCMLAKNTPVAILMRYKCEEEEDCTVKPDMLRSLVRLSGRYSKHQLRPKANEAENDFAALEEKTILFETWFKNYEYNFRLGTQDYLGYGHLNLAGRGPGFETPLDRDLTDEEKRIRDEGYITFGSEQSFNNEWFDVMTQVYVVVPIGVIAAALILFQLMKSPTGYRVFVPVCAVIASVGGPLIVNGMWTLIGVTWTEMMLSLIFIAIGAGIANCIIVFDGFQSCVSPKRSLSEITVDTLVLFGPYGLMTTTTTMLAFGISIGSAYPCIMLWSICAVLSMFLSYVLSVTFFLAACVADEANRRSKFSEGKSIAAGGHSRRSVLAIAGVEHSLGVDAQSSCPSDGMPGEEKVEKDRLIDRICLWYANWLVSRTGFIVVWICTLVLISSSLYAATTLGVSFANDIFCKDVGEFGKYVKAASTVEQAGSEVYVVLKHKEFKPFEDKLQILDLRDKFASMPNTNGALGLMSVWHDLYAFMDYFGPLLQNGNCQAASVAETTSCMLALMGMPLGDEMDPVMLEDPKDSTAAFERGLYNFLHLYPFNVVGGGYLDDVVEMPFNHAEKYVDTRRAGAVSYMRFFQKNANDIAPRAEFYNAAVVMLEQTFGSAWTDTVMLWSYSQGIDTMGNMIKQDVFMNMAIGLFCVFLCMCFFVDYRYATIAAFVLVFLDILLLGWMWVVQYDFNIMVGITLSMAVGFAVDYASDITFAFMSSSKTTIRERTIDAVHSMGPAIVNGAVGTCVGVTPLLIVDAPGMNIFVIMIYGIVLCGIWVGYVVLPQLFYLLAPDIEEVEAVVQERTLKAISGRASKASEDSEFSDATTGEGSDHFGTTEV